MARIRVEGIVIDCPDGEGLMRFYHQLTGMEIEDYGDAFPTISDKGWSLVFQQVANYQGPTWPTQERGQQIHLDFATTDMEAAARYAESIGATRADTQPAEEMTDLDFIVLLDPVGHPFCLVQHFEPWDGPVVTKENGPPAISLRTPFVDCPDHVGLAGFYASLLGGSVVGETNDEWTAIQTPGGLVLCFQRVEGYQPPTWPTQERGQQMHVDFVVDDLDVAVGQAVALGATVVDREAGRYFVVLKDPAGHPFCLCYRGGDVEG